jgi:hypothetical protein
MRYFEGFLIEEKGALWYHFSGVILFENAQKAQFNTQTCGSGGTYS